MKKYMDSYAASFAAAGFSRRKDLYVASGLLSYNASKEMNDMMTFLGPHARCVWMGGGCSSIVVKLYDTNAAKCLDSAAL